MTSGPGGRGGKGRRGGRPVPLGQAMGRWLDATGLSRRLELARAVDRWPDAVGPQIAAVTRAEAVNAQGILWVRVLSSPWATELSLMTPGILAQLNRGGKGPAQVREIRWLTGPIAPERRQAER
ncbi:MAG TPA: DUF721 domain-containing protein [Gemmatimonadales bacterium]|nr:DUF721 domain-containing protein [Gemmatimonadales bacterium]